MINLLEDSKLDNLKKAWRVWSFWTKFYQIIIKINPMDKVLKLHETKT